MQERELVKICFMHLSNYQYQAPNMNLYSAIELRFPGLISLECFLEKKGSDGIISVGSQEF